VSLQYKDNGTAVAKCNAKSTLIILSKSYLTKETETISTLCQQLILNTRNVYNIICTQEIDPSVHQNTELDHVLKLSRAVLFWQDLKFWEKLLTLIPASIADKMVVSQTNYSGSGVYGETDIVNGHEYNSTLTLSQSQIKLNTLTPKTRLKPSIFSAVESNNEFIYLTPKPKKSRCQPGEGVHAAGGFDTLHGRSNSEVYQQIIDSPELGTVHHQRSRSHHAPLPVSLAGAGTGAPSPLIGTYNPRHSAIVQSPQSDIDPNNPDSRNLYGSSSFIYKLISSSQHDGDDHSSGGGMVSSPQQQLPPQFINGTEYDHQRSRSLMQQQEMAAANGWVTPQPANRNPVIHQKSKSAVARQGHMVLDQGPGMGRVGSYGHLTLNRPPGDINGYIPQTRIPPPGHVTLSRVNSNGQIGSSSVVTSPNHMMVVTSSPTNAGNHYLSNNIINGGVVQHQYVYSPGSHPADMIMSPADRLGGVSTTTAETTLNTRAFSHMTAGGESPAHRKYPSNIADEESSSRHNSPSVAHQRSKSTPYQGFVV